MNQSMMPRYITPMEVARRLRVSRASVYVWARSGRLPGAVRINGTLRINRDELESYLRRGGDLTAAHTLEPLAVRPAL